MSKIYVYRRVSTTEQNTARQLPDFKCDIELTEKVSGKDTKRLKLQTLLDTVSKGDSVHVHELSRLARSVSDLTAIVEHITGAGASITFHKENLTFESGKRKNSMAALMLNMLGAVAQFERDIMLERQREGIAVAKKAGVYKGRQSNFTPEQFKSIAEHFKTSTDKTKLAKHWKISRSYLYEIAGKYG